jgi:hypothetical protein
VRAPGAVASIAALLWGFLQAPFFHIHPEDLDHSATSSPVHIHVRAASNTPGPTIGALTADDDAIDVPWSIVRPAGVAFALDLAVPESAMLIPAPALVSAAVPIPQRRGHDPPDVTPKHPRAPPA